MVALAALSVALVSAGETAAGAGGVGIRGHPEGPPPGHTGGFGEPTCQVCHAEYALNSPGGGLSVEGLPDRWEPGVAYVLTVVLRSEGMGAAGFQLALRHADGRLAGRLDPLDGRVAVDAVGDTVPPGAYARQTREGSRVDDPALATWQVRWIAPATPDAVWLHGAANSGDGDNSPFGDLVYTTTLSLRSRAPSR